MGYAKHLVIGPRKFPGTNSRDVHSFGIKWKFEPNVPNLFITFRVLNMCRYYTNMRIAGWGSKVCRHTNHASKYAHFVWMWAACTQVQLYSHTALYALHRFWYFSGIMNLCKECGYNCTCISPIHTCTKHARFRVEFLCTSKLIAHSIGLLRGK